MKRNTLWRMAALILVLVFALTACGPKESPAPAGQPAQPELPYKGVQLRVVGANHPWMESLAPKIPEFEQATGIKVVLENYGEDQLNQKLTTEFTAGTSDIDVFMQRPLQEARVMQQNGWYVDLMDLAKKDADYDYNDLAAGALGTELVNGVLTGIPIVTEQEVLYYRKDVLEQAGIAVPTTLDELLDAAIKLNDPAKDFYGFVARGQRSPLITQFSSFLYSYGGDWFDANKKATVNTPEALAAMELYSKLLREYGPPGTLNMSWPQAVAVFAQGKAAFYTDASSIFPNLLDPEKSEVAEKTGVAVFPAGPAGSVMYNVTSWGLSMYSGTKNKEAAWEFISWATGKEMSVYIQGEGGVPGARNSAWSDPKGTTKFPADWVVAVQASANGRGYDRPLVTSVTEARDIIGQAVVTGIEGGDLAAAANKANTEFQALLDAEK